jgi:hypothetical protein
MTGRSDVEEATDNKNSTTPMTAGLPTQRIFSDLLASEIEEERRIGIQTNQLPRGLLTRRGVRLLESNPGMKGVLDIALPILKQVQKRSLS